MSTIGVQDIQLDPLATAADQPRQYGLCAGRFTVSTGFGRALPDAVLKEFEGA